MQKKRKKNSSGKKPSRKRSSVVKDKTITFTMRLLQAGSSPESAIKTTTERRRRFGLDEVTTREGEKGRLFVGQVYSNSPAWVSYISQKASDPLPGMLTGGAAAILFYPVGRSGKRTIAVCFGHSHIPLDLDMFERHFGLRVTLNTVPRSQLRTLDIATPDAVTFQKRIQASRDSDLREFGIDIFRDLARVAGGTPLNTKFAKFVAGKDSLSITCAIAPEDLWEKCKEVFQQYQSRAYLDDYSWIDNLKPVRSKKTIGDLDKKLMEAITSLRDGGHDELHMAPPEVVDYTEGSLVHFNGFGSKGKNFYRLSIDDYIEELNLCQCEDGIDEIKAKHRIRAARANTEEFSEKWRVYDCFIYEVSLGSRENLTTYVLFSGQWYEIGQDFKSDVEASYQQILVDTAFVEATTAANEQEFIQELETRDDLVKLDQTKINPDGVKYANLEPCDFFSDQKEFIHLKDGHSSAPISHLWMQGVVSAEAFVSDGKFRQDLRAKVKQLNSNFAKLLPTSTQQPIRSNFPIIYGVMRQPKLDGSLDLPFFSKVSLRAAIERLRQLDFSVSLHLIRKDAADSE